MKEQVVYSTDSIKTDQLKETDYYKKLTEEQKKDVDEFLYWLWYIQGTKDAART